MEKNSRLCRLSVTNLRMTPRRKEDPDVSNYGDAPISTQRGETAKERDTALMNSLKGLQNKYWVDGFKRSLTEPLPAVSNTTQSEYSNNEATRRLNHQHDWNRFEMRGEATFNNRR